MYLGKGVVDQGAVFVSWDCEQCHFVGEGGGRAVYGVGDGEECQEGH